MTCHEMQPRDDRGRRLRRSATVPFWIDGRRTAAHSTRGAATSPIPSTGDGDPHRAAGQRRGRRCGGRAARARRSPAWRATSPLRRARILTRFRELLEAHQKELAAIISEEHGKVFLDAMGSVQRGIEVVEFAARRAASAEGRVRGIGRPRRRRAIRCCSRSACAPASRRSTFPAMVPLWMFPVALGVRQHVHPEAVGEGSVAVDADGGAAEGGRAARRRVQRRARRQGGGGRDPRAPGHRRGVVRRLDADREVHLRRPPRRTGKRVQALGGAKNHAVVHAGRRHRRSPPTRIIGAAYGSAGERCMAISAVVAVGDAGDALVAQLAERARALKVGPGMAHGRRHGSGRHRRAPQTDRRLHRCRRRARARRSSSTAAACRFPGTSSGFFVGPTLFDRVTPAMAIYRDEIFGPVLVVVRVAIARRGDRARQRQSVRQRRGALHALRRRGAHLRAGRRGRHGRHQRADSGADGVLFVRRMEAVAVRRPPRARHGRDQVLHAHEGRSRGAGPGDPAVGSFHMPTLG